MAFQPYTDPNYAYPGAVADLGGNLGDASTLTETQPGSRLAVYQIGDYAYPLLAPVPHVEAILFTFADGTETITAYRTAAGRTVPVRGQIDVYAVGGVNIIDWQAPAGIPVTYRAEQFDSDGNSLGYGAPFSTQLDFDGMWVHNPFDPAGAVRVTPASGTAATIPRPTPGDTYRAAGSGLAVTIYGQRQGVTEAPFSFFTFTEEDGNKVRVMLGDPYTSPSTPPLLVIRTGTDQRTMRFPQPFIAGVDLTETPVDAETGGTIIRWDGTATEIPDPAPALVAALIDLDDLDASYATLDDLDAAYQTLFEIDRDYTLAGAAPEET